jgi:glycosyltransferase involved in cell wall biosynthesis
MQGRRVYLYVGRSAHPIYREQLHAVPDGFAYRVDHPDLADATAATRLVRGSSARASRARELAERAALRVLGSAGHVRRARATAQAGDDLIHSTELLLRRAPRRYVVDFEHAECFVLYQHVALERPWARRRLRQAVEDPSCRYLMAWSDWARDGMLRTLGPELPASSTHKVVTVLPAIRPAVERARERRGGPLRALFIGTKFYEKGAVEAVEALRRARRTHDVQLDLVSFVPDEWRCRLEGEPGVRLHRPGGHDVVGALYAQSDVLLFPSHMDTFGYVIMEANAHGLPVLGPAHQAVPELISDGETGLLFGSENPLYGDDGLGRFAHVLPPPRSYMEALARPTDEYVDTIAAALARLSEDPALHARLATGALERVRSGMFSIERRRELLGRLYADALSAA